MHQILALAVLLSLGSPSNPSKCLNHYEKCSVRCTNYTIGSWRHNDCRSRCDQQLARCQKR